MLAALIIAAIAATLTLAAVVLTVVTGWFPRLTALGVRLLELLLCPSEAPRLTQRDRSELIARLWVP